MALPFPLEHAFASAGPNVVDLGAAQWTLQCPALNISVAASIPSYAHLDLYKANVIPDPEYGLNFANLTWIWKQNWTYMASLRSLLPHVSESLEPARDDGDQTVLLFHGLDTFVSIDLCGQHVASTNNQFRQYNFDVTDLLSRCQGAANLSLNFGSAANIASALANVPGQVDWPAPLWDTVAENAYRVFVRKQGNDFGWDWGPAFVPAGPWRPAQVVRLKHGQIHPRNVLVDVYRQGQRSNEIPDQSQPWIVNASIDYIGTPLSGAHDPYMSFVLKDAANTTVLRGDLVNTTSTDGTITGTTRIPDDMVDKWWPAGMGRQALYWLTVSVSDEAGATLTSVSRRIGFRTIVLNTQPVTEHEVSKQGIAPGNHWHFEINGRPFFAKGSNFIPPDVFWPRVTTDRIRSLFEAAVAGNQNMLRVWSSGAYSPDFMYDLADEMGLLLWSEFQFSDCLYPTTPQFLDNVYEEAVYQVRRVNHHPSLAHWAGANELENLVLSLLRAAVPDDYPRLQAEYEKLFLSTLFPAVFENSRSISYAPSSTTNGFVALNFTDAPYMQERYDDGTPGHIYGNTDYYNYDAKSAFNTSEYPIGRFAVEFGFHSMPAAQTWREYAPADQILTFDSPLVLGRNRHYAPVGLNMTDDRRSSMGMSEMTKAAQYWYPTPNKTDAAADFAAWAWTTQVFQAAFVGAQIEFYRRGAGRPQRTLGSLYWQLEDQWVAPTWAGIDRAGRWKVLHYRARDLYSPVIVSAAWDDAGTGVLGLWVSSDLWTDAECEIEAQWLTWGGDAMTDEGDTHSHIRHVVTAGALNSTYLGSVGRTGDDGPSRGVLRMHVKARGRRPNSDVLTAFEHTNWFHAGPLSAAQLLDPGLVLAYDGARELFTVRATTGISAWTWLDVTTTADEDDDVVVTFADNGFWLAKGESKTLGFTVHRGGKDGMWVDRVTVQSMWNNTLAS